MFKLAFPADLLEVGRMAEMAAVEEIVAIEEDNTVKVKQEVEVAKQIIAMLDAITARKRNVLPTFAQNWQQYQSMMIRVANL